MHGLLGAGAHTFSTLNAFVMVYYRVAVVTLRYSSHRANTYQRTHMVMRTQLSINFYHWFIRVWGLIFIIFNGHETTHLPHFIQSALR